MEIVLILVVSILGWDTYKRSKASDELHKGHLEFMEHHKKIMKEFKEKK